MIDFLNRLFGRQPSSVTAKERLRLVLMSDHLSLAPEMVDAMKRDLVDVISRYVEVDRSKIEVNFEQQDRTVALLANIPILSVSRNGGADGGSGSAADGEAVTPPAAAIVGEASTQAVEPPAAQSEPVAAEAPATTSSVSVATNGEGAPPVQRKKRRRKKPRVAVTPATAS